MDSRHLKNDSSLRLINAKDMANNSEQINSSIKSSTAIYTNKMLYI